MLDFRRWIRNGGGGGSNGGVSCIVHVCSGAAGEVRSWRASRLSRQSATSQPPSWAVLIYILSLLQFAYDLWDRNYISISILSHLSILKNSFVFIFSRVGNAEGGDC